MMQGWGFSGILLILLFIIVFVKVLNYFMHSAINKSEFKRSVDSDLKKIKEDINSIVEQLKSKDNK